MSFFTVSHTSSQSKARRGRITTVHGVIETPAFVPVATKGTLKSLMPTLLTELQIQVAFVNTYHLVTHPGPDIIEKAGGIHPFSRLSIPLMSDSGGFQVFSLAKNKRAAGLRGTLAMPSDEKQEALIEKISEDGVRFRSTTDGSIVEFTPEKSIQYQKQIGADLMMAFDECTYLEATEEYARKSMERTHRWLERCISEFKVHRSSFVDEPRTTNQFLYGIIQGGRFEKLRRESAEFVVNQPTDGVAIGGVSVGESKEEMREQVAWVADYLPTDKPVHLLGVGQVDDILDLVKHGIDTFDCVEPTRLARMGVIYQWGLPRLETPVTAIDVNKNIYKDNMEKVDENCDCYVCVNFTKAYLHHLFKQRELLGYTLATYHNLAVMERLMGKIRRTIENNLL